MAGPTPRDLTDRPMNHEGERQGNKVHRAWEDYERGCGPRPPEEDYPRGSKESFADDRGK